MIQIKNITPDLTNNEGTIKPKLVWKKPRIICLNISKTEYDTIGGGHDATTFGTS